MLLECTSQQVLAVLPPVAELPAAGRLAFLAGGLHLVRASLFTPFAVMHSLACSDAQFSSALTLYQPLSKLA